MSWDPYLDLQHGVLRNRLGITDRAELSRVEAALSAARIGELALQPLPGGYDLDHLQDFHHYIFGDVYPWAGELRTVSIAKGGLFCMPEDLDRAAAEVFGRLAADRYLRGRARAAFVDGLTALFAQVNALHPFREGNGRTQRAFLTQLAADAGYRIDWTRLDPTLNVEASRAAQDGDHGLLRKALDPLVTSTAARLPGAAPPPPRTPDE